MKRFEDYDPEEQKVMAQFANHMREVVEKRTCNVVRDYAAARDRNSGLCIENLDAAGNPELRVTEEEAFGEFHLFTRHAGGVGLGLDSEKLVGVLDSLSPREREALLLGGRPGDDPSRACRKPPCQGKQREDAESESFGEGEKEGGGKWRGLRCRLSVTS